MTAMSNFHLNDSTKTPGAIAPTPIWYRLLSLRSVKALHIFFSVAIVLLSFLLPEGGSGDTLTEFLLAHAPADARASSEGSAFPLAFVLSYSFSLVAAPIAGVAMCLCPLNLAPILQLSSKRSAVGRTIWVLGMMLFVAAPYFLELRPVPGQVSFLIAEGMRQNRLLLFIVCESLYLTSSAFTTLILYELTNLFKWAFREKLSDKNHN